MQPASPYPPGAGLCLTGDTGGCPKLYDNIGLDAIVRFMGGILQLAGHGGLEFLSFDPVRLSLRLGVLFQAPLASHVAIIFDPRIFIGITERDAGNKEILSLPLGVQFWATDMVRLAVRTLFEGPLDQFSDFYRGSLGAFAAFAINDMIEPFVAFDFLNLYGKGGGAEARALLVGTNLRF